MGTSQSRAQGGGAIIKRTGAPPALTGPDQSKCTHKEGPLMKMSRRGAWQRRYFKLNNHFLLYYDNQNSANSGGKLPAGAINLSMVSKVDAEDVSAGEFALEFMSDFTSYRLSTNGDPRDADAWLEALEERIVYARRETPAALAAAGGAAGSGGAVRTAGAGAGAGRGGDSSDDEAARRRPDNDDDDGAAAGRGGRTRRTTRRGGRAMSVADDDDGVDDDESDDGGAGGGGRAARGSLAFRDSAARKPAGGGSRMPRLGEGEGSDDGGGDEDAGAGAGGRSGRSRRPSGASAADARRASLTEAGGAAAAGAAGAAVGAAAGAAAATRGRGREPSSAAGGASGGDDEDGFMGRRGASPVRARSQRRIRGGDVDDDEDAGGGAGGRGTTRSHSRAASAARGGAGGRSGAAATPAAVKAGWAFLRSLTRFGRDQKVYLTLSSTHLITSSDASDPEGSAISYRDLAQIVNVDPSTSGHKGCFSLVMQGKHGKVKYRVDSASGPSGDADAEAREWIATIRKAMAERFRAKAQRSAAAAAAASNRSASRSASSAAATYGRSGTAAGGSLLAAAARSGDGSDDGADSDDDRDAAPAPRWFNEYVKAEAAAKKTAREEAVRAGESARDDGFEESVTRRGASAREAEWQLLSMRWFDSLFAGIYRSAAAGGGADDDAVATSRDAGGQRINVSELDEATTTAAVQFLERVRECRSRRREDIVKNLVSCFDLALFQRLSFITTGDAPDSLTPLQMLKVIDCLEGFLRARTVAIGATRLSPEQASIGKGVREARKDMVDRYIDVMAPKLRQITEGVLGKLSAQKESLVRQNAGGRLGTTSPADLFNLMSVHLTVAKKGGSLTLQRRLLSRFMGEISNYAGTVLFDVMEYWRASPRDADIDFVTACINDCGTMMDLLEQLEADFAPALAQVAEAAGFELRRIESLGDAGFPGSGGGTDRSGGGAGGSGSIDEADEFDREEEERAREDLAAIAQDIPRARAELLKCGSQLTGVLMDIIAYDLQASCNLLFTKKWLTENLVTAINGAVIGYLNDLQPNLDSYWFGILANLTLSWVVANYCMRLVSPELVAKQPAEPGGGGPAYKGGLGTLSMSPAVRGRVAADHVELQSAFERYALLLGAGVGQSLTLTLRPLKFLTEVLTLPTDVYLSFESAIVNTPATSVEIYMAFERLIGLREDLKKADKRDIMADAKRIVLERGQPLEEADELVVMSTGGSAMTSGHQWDDGHREATIYRLLFAQKDTMARSKDLFKGWAPPPGSAAAAPASPGGGAGAVSLSAFLGGGGGGAVGGAGAGSSSSSSSAGGSAGLTLARHMVMHSTPAEFMASAGAGAAAGGSGLSVKSSRLAMSGASSSSGGDSSAVASGAASGKGGATPAAAGGGGAAAAPADETPREEEPRARRQQRRRGRRGGDDDDDD